MRNGVGRDESHTVRSNIHSFAASTRYAVAACKRNHQTQSHDSIEQEN